MIHWQTPTVTHGGATLCCQRHSSRYSTCLRRPSLQTLPVLHVSLLHVSLLHVSLVHVSLVHVSLVHVYLVHVALVHVSVVHVSLDTLVCVSINTYTNRVCLYQHVYDTLLRHTRLTVDPARDTLYKTIS